MPGFCLCVSGNRARGVQKVGGRWEVSLMDPRECCNRFALVENQSQGVNTASVNRRQRVTAV